MLSKLAHDLPVGPDWLYEPKWDGFRAIVFRDGRDVEIASRDKRPFNRYFPELEPVFRAALPKRCVVDGEIIICRDGKLDFDSLLLRIHPAESRVALLAKQTPASFVAFDLIALGDRDLRATPFVERRKKLECALRDHDDVTLTPQTDDPADAERWFEGGDGLGLDGVIAKRKDLQYSPGDRVMVKVKRLKTVDCVVGGYRLSKSGDGVGSLLLGAYDGSGVLHYVGHTSSFKAPERRDLLRELRPLEGGHCFGAGRSPGGPSRWTGGRDVSWVPLEPKLVCEVSYDKVQGDRIRHAATFVRWRPEKPPGECSLDQLFGG